MSANKNDTSETGSHYNNSQIFKNDQNDILEFACDPQITLKSFMKLELYVRLTACLLILKVQS